MESPSEPNGALGLLTDDLLATQKLLRATLDASLDMIQVFKAVRNQEGHIVDFTWILNNHASEKIYGDVVGKSLLQLQPGVAEEGIFTAFTHVVETGEPQQYEKHYVHEQFDGWFYQSVVKLNDGVATTTTDITLRKTAEQQLQQSRAFLQSVIDSSLDVIQVFKAVRDKTGAIMDFIWVMNNQKAVAQNGEVIGKSLLKLNPGVVPTGIFDRMVEVAQTGIAYEQEQYYHHEQFDGWFYQALVKTDDGVAMTTRDISRQKQAEREVLRLKDEIAQQATDKYQVLFNSIDQGFNIIELIFNDQGHVIDYWQREHNPVFAQMTGLNNAINKRMGKLVPFVESEWHQMIETIYYTGEPIRVEYPVAALGQWYTAYMSRVGEAGSPFIACLYDNITERKQREQEQAFLLSFSDTLRPLTDPVIIEGEITQLLRTHFEVGWCYYVEWDETTKRGVVHRDAARQGLASLVGEHDVSDVPEFLELLKANPLFAVSDYETYERLTPALRQRYTALGFRSMLVATLVKQGRLVASLLIGDTKIRPWSTHEHALLMEVAQRTWAAIEKAKAEEAVRRSEEKYRNIFEHIDQGFSIHELIIDESSQVTDVILQEVNEAFEQYNGLKNAQGKKVSELVPNLEPVWLDAMTRAYQWGETQRFEAYNDNTDRWITSQYSRIGEAGSRLLSTVFTDVTERKQREQRQELMISIAQELGQLTDEAQLIRAVGTKLAAHLGLTCYHYVDIDEASDQVTIGHYWHALDVPPIRGPYPLRAFVSPTALTAWRAGKPTIIQDIERELSDETPEGAVLKAGAAAQKISAFIAVGISLEGKWKAYFAVADSHPRAWTNSEIDLVQEVAGQLLPRIERARTEEALRESEKRFRLAIEATELGTWEWNLLTDEVYWNEQHFRLFGLEPQPNPITPDVFFNHVYPDERPRVTALLQQAIAEWGVYHTEFQAVLADGSERWMSGYGRVVEEVDGQPARMSGVMFDIDERRRAEDALREADRRKDEFLAMLAHELRNPMSTIRSGLQILRLVDTDDELSSNMVAMMNRQTDHLVRMVDDLLDVSRISRGKIELKKERTNLVELVRQAQQSMESQFAQQGNVLHLRLPSTPIELEGDVTRIAQVITNLLTNGLRYTGDQGQVWLSLEQRAQQAILQVRDNGIGLAANQLSAIFELFVQVDNSLARSKGGLGLGLTLVKRLVEMHGGRVEAQSEGIGKGSTFTVHLPTLTVAAEPMAECAPQVPDRSTSRRVLVIDDNADAAMTLGMLLKIKGYEAHTRTNGRAGIGAVESLQPEAILLDIGMPGMDGYETCRLLRQQPWGDYGVVIALTGYGQEEDRQRTKEAGFDGHLVKPVDMGALLNMLTDLIDKKRNI